MCGKLPCNQMEWSLTRPIDWITEWSDRQALAELGDKLQGCWLRCCFFWLTCSWVNALAWYKILNRLMDFGEIRKTKNDSVQKRERRILRKNLCIIIILFRNKVLMVMVLAWSIPMELYFHPTQSHTHTYFLSSSLPPPPPHHIDTPHPHPKWCVCG